MRSYERSGLQVDQCSDCRGIFLDRGELERLVDAEGAYYERYPGGRDRNDRDERQHDDRDERRSEHREEHRGGPSNFGGLGDLLGGGGKRGHQGGHRKKKKESFLSELFD